jgi:exodeoxyribonuclease V alpha subunit
MTLPIDYVFADRVLKGQHRELLAALFARSREGHLAFEVNEVLPQMPYVVQEGRYLYLEKNYRYQQQIATHLVRILRSTPRALALPTQLEGTVEQQAAVRAAFAHPVSLLLGGPGTGKTYTAAQMVRTFVKEKLHITLAAPTGKAVAQLESSVRRLVNDAADVRYKTVHTLLKGSLFEDVILVDECSMIDVRLFAKLLSALHPGTRLILIGDPDQLPPVEAGSIFADIAEENALACTRLTTCLRTERQEIMTFAEWIRTSDATQARAFLVEQKIGWTDMALEDASKRHLYPLLWEKIKNGVCLLSCMRQGPFGVDALNAYFQEQSVRDGMKTFPILITRSDHTLELYNGDIGSLRAQGDYALFPDRKATGAFREIPALALPSYEMGYCLSVHKSQGSEYDEVFVLVPKGSEVFGREMLYTAATRAKKKVAFGGSLEEILFVMEKSARKLSDLSATLKIKWGTHEENFD